jgi:prepilin-type processing-associated H-X9-DG protein
MKKKFFQINHIKVLKRETDPLFTMVELIVVIATIMILISFLLPALKSAKNKTMEISCMNNQRQVGLALLQYAADYNNDVIPFRPQKGVAQYYNFSLALDDLGYLKIGNIFVCPAREPYTYQEDTPNAIYGMVRPNWGESLDDSPALSIYRSDLSAWGEACLSLNKLTKFLNKKNIKINEAIIVADTTTPYDYLTSKGLPQKQAHVFDVDRIINGAVALVHANNSSANALFADGHVGRADLEGLKASIIKWCLTHDGIEKKVY